MTTTLLGKQEARRPEAAQTETGPALYHWTVDALYRALDAGVFEHPKRLELIQGRIIENMSQDPLHRSMRVRIARRLRSALMPQLVVIEECPVHIAFDGELTPDVVALRGAEADYDERHPEGQDVAILVEVPNTTTTYDLSGKANQYARSGVPDYWVVLVNEAAIVRHRQPTLDGYAEVVRLTGADMVSPLAAPDAVWTVDALLGREEESAAQTDEQNGGVLG